MQYWFYLLSEVVNIDLSKLNTENCSNMCGTFMYMSSLKSLDISSLNTSNVLNMDSMFSCLSSIESLDVSSLNTSNVTDMSAMFSSSRSLTSLDLSNFDTSKVTDMGGMFSYCYSLKKLNILNFDTSNVTNMAGMFSDLNSFDSELDLSHFKTSKVKNFSQMFCYCYNITDINLSSFDTSSATEMERMFDGCRNLKHLYLSNFNTSNVRSIRGMFKDCNGLLNLDLSSFTTQKVNNMIELFKGCISLEDLNITSFDTSNVTSMESMFDGCRALGEINFGPHFYTNNVTNMSSMFEGCESLQNIDLSNFNTSKVTLMTSMFQACKALKSLDLTSFDTPKVQQMNYMFNQCSDLSNLDVSNFNTSNVTNMYQMFYSVNSLKYLDLSSFDTSKVTNASMFLYGKSLEKFSVSDKFNAFFVSGIGGSNIAPPSSSIPGSDGYWYNQDTGEAYLPEEIPSNKKATYIAVNPIKAPVVTVDGSPIYGSKLAVNVTNQPSDTTETTYQWQEYNPNAAGKGWYNSTLPGSETSTLTLTTDENGISCKDKMYRCVVNTKAGLKRVPQVISDVIGPIKQNLSGAIKISTKNISGDKYQSDVLAENVQSDAVLSYEWHGKAVIGDSYGAYIGLSSQQKNTITVYDDAQITISQMDGNYSRNGWYVKVKNTSNQEVYNSGIQYSGSVTTTLSPGTYSVEIFNTDPVSHSFLVEYSSYKEKELPETKSSYVFSSNELKPDSIYCIVRDSSGKYIGSLDSRSS